MTKEIIVGIKNVAKFLDINNSTIHRHIQAGNFPLPIFSIILGNKVKKEIRTWQKSDIENWLQQKAKKSKKYAQIYQQQKSNK